MITQTATSDALTVTGDWTHTDDYRRAYAPTNDPRVLAVIELDAEPQAPDYDAQAPLLGAYEYGDRASFTEYGSTDDGGVRDAWRAARDHNGEDFADRFVSVFYGATVHHLSSHVDRYSWAVVFDVPAWREVCGIIPTATLDRENVAGEVAAWLDGEVYGVGWATLDERTTEETPAELDDFDVVIECWGHYGETYARECAAGFYNGTPNLPPMIPGTMPTTTTTETSAA